MNRLAIAAVLFGGLVALGILAPLVGGDSANSATTTATPESAATPVADEPAQPAPENVPAESPAPEGPPLLGPVPDLVALDGWLQTDATEFDAFDGQVRIVQFWTFTCHNCTATIPHLQEIYADGKPRGLEIIGVHAPEFDRERDPAAVQQAAIDLGVTWPIALDTEKTNFRSWQGARRFWPRTYVIDQNNQIRFDHIGEGQYDELAATVDWLLDNPPPPSP